MARLKDFEVNIITMGRAAAEYEDGDATTLDNRITKYIQVVPSATFAVQFKIKRSYRFDCDYLGWTIFIDGKEVAHPLATPEEFRKRRGYTYAMHGAVRREGAVTKEKEFHFAEMQIR